MSRRVRPAEWQAVRRITLRLDKQDWQRIDKLAEEKWQLPEEWIEAALARELIGPFGGTKSAARVQKGNGLIPFESDLS